MLFLLFFALNGGITLEKVAPVDWTGNPAGIWSNAISPEGRIFFACPQQGKIFSTNLSGKALPSIGKKGQGPGEFNWPRFIIFNDNFLYVYDAAREKLYQINPETQVILKKWQLSNTQDLSISGNHIAASLKRPQKSHIFGTGNIGETEIKFHHFMGGTPESLQVSGANISALLHASDGTLWMTYSGEFQLQQFTRKGKQLQFIDDPPRDYVVPSQSQKISRFNTKAMSENVRRFDKTKALYEVKNHIVLYRPKILNNSYLDIFTKKGKRIASHKSDGIYPIGVSGDEFYAFLVAENDEPWDLMIVKIHFR